MGENIYRMKNVETNQQLLTIFSMLSIQIEITWINEMTINYNKQIKDTLVVFYLQIMTLWIK